MKRKPILALALFLSTFRVFPQAGIPVWTNRYNGPANLNDIPLSVAVDINGNTIVAGVSSSSLSTADFATIKYSPAGTVLWMNRYTGAVQPAAVHVDSGGNVLVAGNSSAGAVVSIKYSSAGALLWSKNLSLADPVSAADGSSDLFVAGRTGSFEFGTMALSGAGSVLWTNSYNGPGNGQDVPTAMAVDANANVFVTAYSSGGGTSLDYATIKYSDAGAPLWTNRYNGAANGPDSPTAIAVDGAGNVMVTGSSSADGSSTFSDFLTIKYSSDGTPLWTNRYHGSASSSGDQAVGIVVDGSGNVLITGTSGKQTPSTLNDYATIKYSGAGVPLWTNRYSRPENGDSEPTAIAVDAVGNVFVTGSSAYADGSVFSYATVAYSSTGLPLWTNLYNGPANYDGATALAVDSSGNVCVTGESSNSNGRWDYATIKYSSSIPSSARLNFSRMSNQLVLSWTNAGFSLQSAPKINGSFTNIPNATSPYTNRGSLSQQFFRLQLQ